MRILTLCGTRPELIRLSVIIAKLDELLGKDHIFVYTGQNYDPKLSDIFFSEMCIRKPDYNYRLIDGMKFGEQLGAMLDSFECVLREEKPDKILILGDTNSALCSITASRLGIPVYHMEAGNRSYDKKVPEELNRRIVDNASTVNLPYTNLSKENLIAEGFHKKDIFVVGNPIYEVLNRYEKHIYSSTILSQLGLCTGEYFLATFHRSDNVDDEHTLRDIMLGLHNVAGIYNIPVVCSVHPRTASKIKQFKITSNDKFLKLYEPFGFFDFEHLLAYSKAALTDSGTVPESGCLHHIPSIIIRRATERTELLECGSAIMSGKDISSIENSVKTILGRDRNWNIPEEYLYKDVSSRVINLLIGT